jgi:hypothetical protein
MRSVSQLAAYTRDEAAKIPSSILDHIIMMSSCQVKKENLCTFISGLEGRRGRGYE